MKKDNPNREGKYSHLSLAEREEIAIGLENGLKQYEIAVILGRSASTISRELKRNSPQINSVRYRANRAHLKADERKKSSHQKQRISNKRLRRFICRQLRKGYSPEIIAIEAAKKQWNTNYESIYQWIYKDRQDLIPFLAKSHKNRRKRTSGKQKRCPKVPNRTMIEQRPDYVRLRSSIGDWEADTIISRQSKSAVMVLVDRCIRYTILKKLDGKNAYSMHKAVVKSLKEFPNIQRRSITYDNGTENALHELTNEILGTKSYFCHPYHSWEKGTVENIIGIVRRFYPKKTDWKKITQWDLNKVARFINNRPMKCLGFKTPCQLLVALTA
jgi:IS30 family transposase